MEKVVWVCRGCENNNWGKPDFCCEENANWQRKEKEK